MHISEGILSGPVIISGIVLAAAGTAMGLKKLNYDCIPRAAILSASFFVASLIHAGCTPAGHSSISLGCFLYGLRSGPNGCNHHDSRTG